MPTDFVICTRAVKDNSFTSEPGETRFLKVPEREEPTPGHKLESDPWVRELYKQAVWGTDSRTGAKRGDILVFIHGFNNCTEYFARLDSDALIKGEDQREVIGSFDHSWHIGNLVFAGDLFDTLRGDLDRTAIPTREMNDDGTLKLVRRSNA